MSSPDKPCSPRPAERPADGPEQSGPPPVTSAASRGADQDGGDAQRTGQGLRGLCEAPWFIALRWLLLIPGSLLAGIATAMFVSLPVKVLCGVLQTPESMSAVSTAVVSSAGFAFALVYVGARTAPSAAQRVANLLLVLMCVAAVIAGLNAHASDSAPRIAASIALALGALAARLRLRLGRLRQSDATDPGART
ncbi:MAG: hypothetical protein KDK91_22035 [Gammaproteobacteria bacterium]|nr:hypothetical protein [Gammaproteobacteria bacterium]